MTENPADSWKCPRCGQLNWGLDRPCPECDFQVFVDGELNEAFKPPPPPEFAAVEPRAYHCPACGVTLPPQIVKRLSPGGWVVLAFGLLLCLVGALFSLFFIEEHAVCPACGYRVR